MEEGKRKSIYELLYEEEFLQPEIIERLLQSARDKILPALKQEAEVLKKILKIVQINPRFVDRDASVLKIPLAGLDGSSNGDSLFGVYYTLISAAVVSYRQYEDPNPTVFSRAMTLKFPPHLSQTKRKEAIQRALLEAKTGLNFLEETKDLPKFLFKDGPLVPSSRLLPLHSWVSYGKSVGRDDEEYCKMAEDYFGKPEEGKVAALLNFYNKAREKDVALVGIVKRPCTWSFLVRSKDALKKEGLSVEELRGHGVHDRILVEFHGYEFLESNPDKIFYTEPEPLAERPIFSFMYGLKENDQYRALEKGDVYSFYVKIHLNGSPIRVEVFKEIAEDKERMRELVNLLHFTAVPYPRGTWPVIYVPSPILAAHDKCTVKNPTLGLIGEDLRNQSIKALGDVGDLITRPTWISWLLYRAWAK